MNQPHPDPASGNPQHPGPQPPPGYGNPPYYPPPPGPPAPPPRKKRLWLKILGVLAVVVAAVAIFGDREPARAPAAPAAGTADSGVAEGQVTEAGVLSALDLQEGDCYNSAQLPPAPGTSQPIDTVDVVPCTEPHTHQVLAKIGYGAEVSLADVTSGAREGDCDARFTAVLEPGVLENSDYQLGRIVPANVDTWATSRTVACYVMTTSPTSTSLIS